MEDGDHVSMVADLLYQIALMSLDKIHESGPVSSDFNIKEVENPLQKT